MGYIRVLIVSVNVITMSCLAAKGLTPTFFPHFLPLVASSDQWSAEAITY